VNHFGGMAGLVPPICVVHASLHGQIDDWVSFNCSNSKSSIWLLRGDKDATQLFVEMEPSVILPLSE
jgi:hypothetical protein